MIDRGAKRFADRPRRRCSAEEGRRAVEAWLRKHDITIDEVRLHKPPAHVYVDGRAVRFRGNWDDVLDEIRQFWK
jgi:hypothetical protein